MAYQRLLLSVAKLTLFVLVLGALWRAGRQAFGELDGQHFSWQQLQFGWLACAGGLYLSAQFVLAIFWRRLLRAMGQTPRLFETFRAFLMGHVGKYVPGKMFTVLLRTAFLQSERAKPLPVTISVFFETLIYMAVGACLAAVVLFVQGAGSGAMRGATLMFAVGAIIATWPPLIGRLVALVRSLRKSDHESGFDVPLIDVATWLSGWFYCTLAWCLHALSLWAVIRAMPTNEPILFDLATMVRMLGAVTMAVVAGFASFLPGAGLGVREWVLDQWLAVPFGAFVAIVSAILLRIVWLLTEVASSAILYFIKPPA
jgi:hypothetical protein